MNSKIFFLILKTDKPITQSASTLRGFVANRFPDQPILHQHERDGFIYLYPRVQYKIINGIAKILGITEGVGIVKEICDKINYIELGKVTYHVEEKEIVEKMVELGENFLIQQYMFLTPWLALNQNNYQEWQRLSLKGKREKLRKILVGNILSMAKGLEYVITEEIRTEIDVRPVSTFLKDTPMLGFLGTFSVNFNIPDYFGLGKSVSRGFGTVVKVG